MATSTIQFFSTLEEWVTIVQSVVADLHLSVFLYSNVANNAIKQSSGITVQEINDFGASCLFLAQPNVDISQIDPKHIQAGQLGLIDIRSPYIDGQTLFIGSIAVKTDWFDRPTNQVLVNDRLMPLFRKIKPYIVKNMMPPVLAVNIVTGASAEYAAIKYTKGTKAFNENGGELMQLGVKNLRFRCI
jgi:hypothetical protein